MRTEIYYFSGTGNSLFVAKELQKRIPDSLVVPIVSRLQNDVIPTQGTSVGIVFPVHALTLPLAVKRFLKKVDLSATDYVFAVATRLGTVFDGFTVMERLLRKKHRRLDSRFLLTMGSNDCKVEHYRCPTEGEIIQMKSAVLDRIEAIREIVNHKTPYQEKDREYLYDCSSNRLLNFFLMKWIAGCLAFSEYIGGVNYFYSQKHCSGCGICQKVCLSQKIVMVDKKPVWQKKILCYMCYACINYCPEQAVQIEGIRGVVKSFSTENGRYSHPYATVSDIARQKLL